MLNQPTLNTLRALKLTGLAEAYAQQLDQPEVQRLSFDERLALLVDRELTYRESRRLRRLLQLARLRQNACIEDIDYQHKRGLDRQVVAALNHCDWIRQHHNLHITGPTGCGKPNQTTTHIGQHVSESNTATVIDPRHPLYGQSFTINGMINRPDYGRCFVVWMANGLERHIPISATDQAADDSSFFPLPLCLTSVLNLLAVYARFSQLWKERTDASQPHASNSTSTSSHSATGTAIDTGRGADTNHTTGSLGKTGSATTGIDLSAIGQNLLPAYPERQTDGGKR